MSIRPPPSSKRQKSARVKSKGKPVPKTRSIKKIEKMAQESNTAPKTNIAEIIKMRKLKGNTNGTKLLKGNLKTRRETNKARRIENQLPENILSKFHGQGTSINKGLFIRKKAAQKSQSNLFDNLKDKKIKAEINSHNFIGRTMNTGTLSNRQLSVKNRVKVRKSHISKLERNSKK